MNLLEQLRIALDPLDAPAASAPAAHPPAAVLLLADPSDPDLPVLFIRRADYLRHHPGQIALPGGSMHEVDQSLTDTALREAAEEVGLPPSNVDILGKLPPFATATSDRWLTPIVGLQRRPWEIRGDGVEVAEWFWLTVRELMHTSHRTEQLTRDGVVRDVHFYETPGRVIWGVTGAIVHELLERMSQAGNGN